MSSFNSSSERSEREGEAQWALPIEGATRAPLMKTHRTFRGTVIRASMQKTIVVTVERSKVHPKYGKRYTVTKKYLVHDEKNEHKPGDMVTFVECRPLSKNKRWRVIK